jgi:hypothetical protein
MKSDVARLCYGGLLSPKSDFYKRIIAKVKETLWFTGPKTVAVKVYSLRRVPRAKLR